MKKKKKQTLKKFLKKGQTQIEADSVHSTFERKMEKNRPIHCLADYVSVMKENMQYPKPYEVIYLSIDFFSKIFLMSIVLNKGDSIVIDLRAILYWPGGSIQVKVDFEHDGSDLPCKRGNPPALMHIQLSCMQIAEKFLLSNLNICKN